MKELLARIPESEKAARDIVATMMAIPGALSVKAAAVRADPDLSQDGKTRRIKELAQGASLKHFQQLRAQAAALATETSNLRQAMQPKEPDRADVTAEMRRDQLRRFCLGLPEGKKMQFIMDNPRATEAVLDMPPELSGLTDEMFGRVKAAHIQAMHGPQIAGLAAREEVAATVNAAVQIATREFLEVSGLSAQDLNND